jgi:hypothetical protein
MQARNRTPLLSFAEFPAKKKEKIKRHRKMVTESKTDLQK